MDSTRKLDWKTGFISDVDLRFKRHHSLKTTEWSKSEIISWTGTRPSLTLVTGYRTSVGTPRAHTNRTCIYGLDIIGTVRFENNNVTYFQTFRYVSKSRTKQKKSLSRTDVLKRNPEKRGRSAEFGMELYKSLESWKKQMREMNKSCVESERG